MAMAAAPLRERNARRFAICDEVVSVRVRESGRAKTARIIVGPQRPLEVIVPAGVEDDEVDALLEEKREWVERKVDAARTIAARRPQLGLDRPDVAWLGGEPLSIVRVGGNQAVARTVESQVEIGGDQGQADAALARWYRRQARARIEEVVTREAQRLGLSYHSIGIRDPRTRWGSCSRRGHLSFSWRLVAVPEKVLEYVVVHEVCHLREPSHSKAFWRLLDAARPGWQEQARWLREHGQELRAYAPLIAGKRDRRREENGHAGLRRPTL
jgi:predicted metal-dependent hydrolase